MPAAIEIKIELNSSNKLEMDFIPHQVGHLAPAEDEMVQKIHYFFKVFTGALQARAERENKQVGRLDPELLKQIAEKALKDKMIDEEKGVLEVDITGEVAKGGGSSREKKDERT